MTAVRLERPDRHRLTSGTAAFAAAAAVLLAGVVAWHPAVGFALPVGATLLILLHRVQPRWIVAGVLVFLPFQDLLISRVPAGLQLPVRYAPELVVDSLVVVVLLTASRRRLVLERARPVLLPFAALFVALVAGAVWNGVAPASMLVGLRSEFRFLPLAVLALFLDPRRDGRLLVRAVAGVAIVQCSVVLLEVVGGAPVRALFAPSYELVVGGATVGSAGPPLDTIFGTLPHRNDLGALLAFSWIVIAAAGRSVLGVSTRVTVAVLAAVAAGVLASGSREGAVALAIGALVLAHRRLRAPVVAVAALCSLAAALLVIATVPIRPDARTYIVDPSGNVYSYLHGASFIDRWRTVLTREAWTPGYHTNFRLYLLTSNAGLVWRERPLLGFGIGSVSDPTRLERPSNPVRRTFAGQKAVELGFVYDGNWAVLVLEAGLVGMALLVLVFAALIRLGASIARAHWSGLALMGGVAATAVLGFFAPTLQHRAPTAILWTLVGLTLAAAAQVRPARR